jgi:hypothetical protein
MVVVGRTETLEDWHRALTHARLGYLGAPNEWFSCRVPIIATLVKLNADEYFDHTGLRIFSSNPRGALR